MQIIDLCYEIDLKYNIVSDIKIISKKNQRNQEVNKHIFKMLY